jgi:hypothetical protein
MFNKLVTDATVDIQLDEYEGMVDIYDETLFTVARVTDNMVESIELNVKEAAKLQRQLTLFVGRHGTRLRAVKARAAKYKARAK